LIEARGSGIDMRECGGASKHATLVRPPRLDDDNKVAS
jgi:hypothetical protein